MSDGAFRMMRIVAGLLILATSLPLAAQSHASIRPPGDSVYRLDATLTDQDGRARPFGAYRGAPRVVSMFYASCPYMCPLIVETIKNTERALPDADRVRLRVTLVSFDSDRDTPSALRALADKRRIDTARWTLARAEATDVRRIAAVLGIQYRRLQNGEFSHSSALVLLDADGRILARTEKLGDPDPEFVSATARALEAQ
jgi:protein SCO1/2